MDVWDDVAARFDAAWRRAQREATPPPPVADYLPVDGDRVGALVELLYYDIEYRILAGGDAGTTDYLLHYPELAAQPAAVADLHRHAADCRHRRPGEPPGRLAPDTRVDQFTVASWVASGGMGDVYRAVDGPMARPVALKVLRSESAGRADMAARFVAEARITGQLQHPGIPPVYQVGTLPDGRPYLAMKLIDGRTLDKLFQAEPAGRHLNVLIAVAQAVGYAHEHGVVHRDLKPHNVMVGAFGETQVMDWGLAKRLTAATPAAAEAATPRDAGDRPAATRAGVVLGTPQYMAPEQARGEPTADARVDVYGLGAILHHLLTGDVPFPGRSPDAVVADLCDGRLPAPPPGSRALVAVCRKAMAPRPGDRYATAGAFATDLQHYLADEPMTACPDHVVDRARRWVKRHRLAATGVVAAAVVAGVTLSVWAVVDRRAERQRQIAAGVRAVAAAKQRGDWRAVIEQSDRVVELGHVADADMVLDRVQAWNGINESRRAAVELAALDGHDDLGSARGRFALYRGVARLGVVGEAAEPTLRHAAMTAATPADRAYAQALLAPDGPAALAHCRAALVADRFHQDARGTGGLLLILLGRLTDARILAEESASLFPDSPAFPTLLMVVAALEGRETETADRLATLQRRMPEAQHDALAATADAVRLWRKEYLTRLVERKPATGWENVLLSSQAIGVTRRVQAALGRIRGPAPSAPGGPPKAAWEADVSLLAGVAVPPFVARPYATVFNPHTLRAIIDPRVTAPLASVRDGLRNHPEGSFWYLCGLLHVQDPKFAAFDRDHLRHTAAAFDRAATADAMFDVRDAAIELRAVAETMVALTPGVARDDATTQAALTSVRARVARGRPRDPIACSIFLSLAVTADDAPLMRQLLTTADGKPVAIHDAVLTRLLQADQQWPALVERLRKRLRDNPMDPEARDLLTKLRATLEARLRGATEPP